MDARPFDAGTIADMATQLPRARWKTLVALLVALPLLAILAIGASIELGNQFGECSQYYGDGTNDWENCIQVGEDAFENSR